MPIPKFWPMAGTMVGALVEFVDEAGVAADPTTVTVTARKPNGDLIETAVTHIGTGIYRAEFLVDVPGRWVVQASGTGALVVTDEVVFDVRKAVIALP